MQNFCSFLEREHGKMEVGHKSDKSNESGGSSRTNLVRYSEIRCYLNSYLDLSADPALFQRIHSLAVELPQFHSLPPSAQQPAIRFLRTSRLSQGRGHYFAPYIILDFFKSKCNSISSIFKFNDVQKTQYLIN